MTIFLQSVFFMIFSFASPPLFSLLSSSLLSSLLFSSLFSCLVSPLTCLLLLFSCHLLLFSFSFSFSLFRLIFSLSVFFLCLLSLSSFSVFFLRLLSPCVGVCRRVCLCVWCGVVCRVVWHAENPVCRLKTPPCVDSKRPRVCRQHAHMLKSMCAWCRQSR